MNNVVTKYTLRSRIMAELGVQSFEQPDFFPIFFLLDIRYFPLTQCSMT